ncbi:MAG: Gfo/Idh/MocA family oxidoreductase [Verrucomicrobiota bacterium]|nr:Gfo/Idh/MocA family oxidoreductase [Verrucomicrobiota bacterium]
MHQNQTKQENGDSRRTFIKKSAAAAAVVAASNIVKTPVYGQNQAPSTGRTIGANDRIVVGYIGVGGQGMTHVRLQKEHASENNIAQAAVCDVWQKRIEGAKNFVGGDCKGYDDYRKMLEQKDIDALVVSTVDHWHTAICVDGMEAGKHIYVEKPMTRYLEEAFQIYDTCKKTKRILTVGSQGCSDYKWHKAAELVKAGRIGKLVMAQGSYPRNNPKGEWNYAIDPDAKAENLNWERWLGPVKKKVPFNADHYFRWRKYYPYCGGLLGDLFPHRLHPYMLATGSPEFPSRVVSLGTKKIESDKNTPGTYMRDVPEHVELLAEFPSGLTLVMISSTVCEHGLVEQINGHHGSLFMSGNRIELRPQRAFADEVDEEKFENLRPGEDIAVHEKNWFDSIRANKEPNAGIDLAVKVQTVISLGEMSERLNISCSFDEKTRKVTTGDGKIMKIQEIKPLTYGSLELS